MSHTCTAASAGKYEIIVDVSMDGDDMRECASQPNGCWMTSRCATGAKVACADGDPDTITVRVPRALVDESALARVGECSCDFRDCCVCIHKAAADDALADAVLLGAKL